MEERRAIDTELFSAISELKTDIKYIVKTMDEMKIDNKDVRTRVETKCDDCGPQQLISSHIESHVDLEKRIKAIEDAPKNMALSAVKNIAQKIGYAVLGLIFGAVLYVVTTPGVLKSIFIK
jgi:hypothetical protein